MKPTDTKQGDKVPRPLSSDQAQKGTPSPTRCWNNRTRIPRQWTR